MPDCSRSARDWFERLFYRGIERYSAAWYERDVPVFFGLFFGILIAEFAVLGLICEALR